MWRPVADQRDSRRVRVDCFLLADAAQEVDNKLFILGGGWDLLRLPGPDDAQTSIALAMRFVVPRSETNRTLSFTLQLEDADGNRLVQHPPIIELDAEPSPELTPGLERTVPFAITIDRLTFRDPGAYAFTISLDGAELARTWFQVQFLDANRPA